MNLNNNNVTDVYNSNIGAEELYDGIIMNTNNNNLKDIYNSNEDDLELKFGSDDDDYQPPTTSTKHASKDYISTPKPTKNQKDNKSSKPSLTESLQKKRKTDKTKNNNDKSKNKNGDEFTFENALLKSLDKKIELEEKKYNDNKKIIDLEYKYKIIREVKKLQDEGIDTEIIIKMIPESKPIFD